MNILLNEENLKIPLRRKKEQTEKYLEQRNN